ncbi:high affinity immunoglobulin alpha and immunoglobulin mu Fc receptor isoform X2 [Notamacropus eugenii]|uniref:high affinity immunoglobulin alpha and immunoglobulin mu Fc receptor isoform X2 n=1 Tax=Notamacropus eugenii TaxID=9315 RepID=UPI003B676168
MEKNALIQPIQQEGTHLRAGWKMIPLFVLCLLQALPADTGALKGPRLVNGDPGGMVTIKCHYAPTLANKHQRKYWCRLYPPQRVCHTVISTNFYISQSYQGRVTLLDFPRSAMFVVTLAQLTPEDAGYYRCGIGPRTDALFLSMNLTISTAQANHSLDSAIVTIPSSIIPKTALATKGQTMETLCTSTSVTCRQDLDTTLLVEGWQTRTSRRDTTPAEVTQAPGTTGTTTGGQDLGTTLLVEGWQTRTSRRDTTPAEVTQAPGTTGTTTGGQDLGTTLLVEGWQTRTSRRDTTPAEVTQAPGTTGTTTGGQDLGTTLLVEGWQTRTSRRDTTPAEVTQAPGTTETTTGGQDLGTTLLVEGWQTRTSRRDTTPAEVTQASGTTGTTTGGQDLGTTLLVEGWQTRTSRRDTTPAEVTQVPGSPGATAPEIGTTGTTTGGQDLGTTLLVEGWQMRTSIRDTTPAEVTQAPGTAGTTTATGGQDLGTTLFVEELETRTSRRDTTPGEVTQVPGSPGATAPEIGGQVPKTIITTALAPDGEVFDTTLVIKRQEAGTCRGHIIPTNASGTIGIITPVTGSQDPGTLGRTTPAIGRQDFDTSLEAGISRDLTLIRVTQLPAQASHKNIQPPSTVRLPIPGTDDWVLETTRAANLVPQGQTSRAKVTSNVMEGGLVLGTRAATKTVVGTIKERRSTVRNTNRLIEGTVNIGIPLITTMNRPSIIRPSAMVRDSLRAVTPGTDQQSEEITRTSAPDADAGAWFSGTITKGKVSALAGTVANSRKSYSEEPLRRIPGAALPISPSNKPFMENSSPDERRVSLILITLSTVLLPFVLLVLLLLLRKFRKRLFGHRSPRFP